MKISKHRVKYSKKMNTKPLLFIYMLHFWQNMSVWKTVLQTSRERYTKRAKILTHLILKKLLEFASTKSSLSYIIAGGKRTLMDIRTIFCMVFLFWANIQFWTISSLVVKPCVRPVTALRGQRSSHPENVAVLFVSCDNTKLRLMGFRWFPPH